MKKVGIAALVAAVLCVAIVAAHEAAPLDTTVKLEQISGPGYGTAKFSSAELESSFYKVGLYQWYTLVDFRTKGDVTCLGTRKSGYFAPNLGKVSICADLPGKPTKLVLVLSKDVSCSFSEEGPMKGKMLAWNPAKYLFQI